MDYVVYNMSFIYSIEIKFHYFLHMISGEDLGFSLGGTKLKDSIVEARQPVDKTI